MSTLIQQDFAKRLVESLNSNGFTAKFVDGGAFDCDDWIEFSKNGVHGKNIEVNDLIKMNNDEETIKEFASDIENLVECCENEVALATSAIANPADDLESFFS